MKFLKFSALILSFALIAGCSDSSSSGAPVNQPAPATTPAPTPTPAPVVMDTRITVGDVIGNGRVEVPVTYEQVKNQQAVGLQFDLTFDNTKLQLVEVKNGPAATAAGKSVSTSSQSASMNRVIVIGGTNTLADGVVAILVFDTIGAGVANLTTSNVKVVDSNPQPGPLTVEDRSGSITIQ